VRGLTDFDEFRTSWDPETPGSNEWGNRAYNSTIVSFTGLFMGIIGILFGLYIGLGIKSAKPVLQVICVPLTFALPLYVLFAAFNIFGIGPIAGIYPVTFSFLLFIACVLFLRATSQTPYTISLFRCLYWSILLSFGVTFLVPSSISNNIQWKIISLTTIALSIAAVVWDYRTTSERRVAGIGFVFWPIIAILGVASVTVFCISFLKSIEASELLQLAFAETLIGILPFGFVILLIEKHRLAQTLPWGITTKQLTPRLIVLKFLLVVCIVAPLISGDWGSNRSELWLNGLFTTLVIFLICQIVSIRRFLDTEQRQPSNSKVITDGPAFDVFLESVGEKKVRVIKAIRKLSGFGIRKTKDLVDKAPVLLKENCTADEANDIKEKLENVGATVSLK
jgi:ribosomal protein L7/L12